MMQNQVMNGEHVGNPAIFLVYLSIQIAPFGTKYVHSGIRN